MYAQGAAAVLVAAGLVVVGLGLGSAVLPGAARGGDGATASAAFVSQATPVAFEDARGDATDRGTGAASNVANCVVGFVAGGGCASGVAPAVGTNGDHYDIVSVAFAEESADDVVFTLGVARLTEGFPELRTPDGVHRMSSYWLCWATDEDDRCARSASLNVMVHDGTAHLDAFFEVYVEACNEWSWCSYSIPVDVTYGEPGLITFRIPKAYAVVDDAPLVVRGLSAGTGWVEEATAFPMWHPGLTVHTPLRHVHTHGGGVAWWNLADRTAFFEAEVALAPPAAPAPRAADAPLLVGAAGMTHADGGPFESAALDLVGADLYEEGDELVVALALADLRALPTHDFDYSVAIGVAGDRVWEVGFRQDKTGAKGYAGLCIMEECQESFVEEVPVDVLPGAPGFILVRVPLDLMGGREALEGRATTLVWASAMNTEGSVYWGDESGGLYGDVHHAFMVDMLVGGTPYVFGSGHRAPLAAYAAGHAH